jgi:hypothetical protein
MLDQLPYSWLGRIIWKWTLCERCHHHRRTSVKDHACNNTSEDEIRQVYQPWVIIDVSEPGSKIQRKIFICLMCPFHTKW